MEDTEAQTQQKKRARRRLVGAVAFATLVAVVLPMIMDHEPRQPVEDVEIRIPGQDEKPFAPKFAVAPVAAPAPVEKLVERPAEPAKPAAEPSAKVVETLTKDGDRPAEKVPAKATEKPGDKVPAKPAEKAAEKPAAKPKEAEVKRAAAILAGQPESAPAKGGEQVILIGAFTNEANVKTLKAKLGELGIRVFTEPLDTPQGRKTRVRAGPFASREAADKALEKMKRIGVSGVVTARQ